MALCSLVLFAAGCGGGREYALPEDLCGVPVGGEELSPLLPDGETLEVVGDPLTVNGSTCEVSVDDHWAVSVQVEKVEKFYDPMGKLDSFRFTNRKKISALPFDGAGATGDRNVMISARCEAPDADHAIVFVTVPDKTGSDVDRRRADMEKFAAAFVPAVKKEMACTA
ncbi:hypothetical protein [Streptomyces sp. NPDC048565]|uniref:hypothetical protein n=1 Tax=Streptomyces sp. NPDC048565 TaxID=3155266 RepID=UPI0034156038